MSALKAFPIAVVCSAALAAGQPTPQELPAFRVAVDLVSIDVVVTDRDGQTVRDLGAADFEVLQSGKPQRVTAVRFVPVDSNVAVLAGSNQPAVGDARGGSGATAPRSRIARDQVRRTMVVVVDDLGLSSQGLRQLLLGLRRFVDEELRPTDVMAIVRTGGSNGLAQSLTNDREVLRASIDALRYNVLSRKGPWPLGDVVQLGTSPPQFDGPERPLSRTESLSALGLIVQAARDLPGRKTVILASEGFPLVAGTAPTTLPEQDPRVRGALDRVIDLAARSGVVLYAIDCTGLETGGLRASDDIHYVPNMTNAVNRFATARQRTIRDGQESLAYLTEQTGGFAVVNTNDLGAGLRRIGRDVRDYYVIGYEPDPGTFASERERARRHTVTVKVRRPDVRVRARKTFTGVSDPERSAAPPTPAEALVRAALSPFNQATIGLHVTALPGYSPHRGTFVRAALHLNARALAFSASAGGKQSATVDLVGIVVDSSGGTVHDISTGFDVSLDSGAVEQLLPNGLVYNAWVPIQKPGGYQLRFAIRDRRTGALGAGGAFVLVPEVTDGALALSGLLLRADQRATSYVSLDSDHFSIPPADALREYTQGTVLVFVSEIYNPGKAVEVIATLWRGEDRLMSLLSRTLVPPSGGESLLATGRIELGPQLAPGTYFIQLVATSDDAKRRNKRSAVQRLSFDIKRETQ